MDYMRQRSWFDPDRTSASVTIVGCGGVGSFTALALAKLGVQKLELVDFDKVEEHNLPNQMFELTHEGVSKVDALAGVITRYALPVDGLGMNECSFQEADPAIFNNDIVVAALDSMLARKALWEKLRMKLKPALLLDARLAGEYIVLYSVRPSLLSDVDGYEKTLYTDSEALDVACTARSVIDVGFAIASLITRTVRKHYAEEEPIQQVFLNQATLEMHTGGW